MEDPPNPTEEEQEQGADRQQDEEAMRGAGHEDPETPTEDEE
jgi:hypothetical protein